MGWHYNQETVDGQWNEFKDFLGHARHDDPPGLSDMFGRLNSRTPDHVPITPTPQPQNNYYLIQLAQLYEAGLIGPEALQQATVNIYS
jgi:hypothetical protein